MFYLASDDADHVARHPSGNPREDASMNARVVVVGGSLAGVRTVQALRRKRASVAIDLVAAEPGSETGVACDRPPLSKRFLADADTAAMPLASPADLDALDVRLVRGRATDLDLNSRRVVLHGGEALPFDHLVVATGSAPRTVPGLEARSGVHQLRTAEDAVAIRHACAQARRVVVVGGGFIGAETAWTLHERGLAVDIVEPLPALMIRGLGTEIGAAFTRRHRAAGIAVHTGAGVAAIEGGEHAEAVRLTNGERLPADLVVLGVGTVPDTG
jgi:NAD(P)H-nitrite reductase large subunit